ncbi:MAG: hypothetical protein JWO17_2408 [Actinomycetia bacterium]|nr:hypothetical protein [Actinomycetes bacterium]
MSPREALLNLSHMITPIGTAAPALAADAFVRGEKQRSLELTEYRGTWVVLAFAVRHADVLELAELEEAFAADGAVVLAAADDDLTAGGAPTASHT